MDKKHGSSMKMKALNNEKTTELAGKIDETDEMKLKMLASIDKPDPEDLLYPPELNAHLIEQLKILTGENNELRKCVFEKGEDLKVQNKTIRDLNQRIRDIISGSGPAISSKSAGIISAKITELCKQNRHLVAELESYKTKNAALERKIVQLDLMSQESVNAPCLCADADADANPDELKDLNNKLTAVNKKLYDCKNRNLELKNDILVATKILQQELGDRFTGIKDLHNDLAGWKGRAQQIALLQGKINVLEEKLNGKQKDALEAKRNDQTVVLRDLEMKRKREVDRAMKELEALKEENADLKRKVEGARCRIRNLECDAVTLRQKMQTLVEKSNHDDLLVNEQRNQIKSLESYYQEILKENTAKMNKMHTETVEYQKLIKNTDAKIDALREQATEKATKIDELRAQLLRYEECSLQSVFFTPMKTATDNEIKKLSDLILVLNERLDTERRKYEELDAAHRRTKEKRRRLERKVIIVEDELKAVKDSRRPSRTSKTAIQKEQTFDGYPSTAVLGKKNSSIAAFAIKTSDAVSDDSPSETYDLMDRDELKFKLELAEEKLKIMEDKLKMIEDEKHDDYNHLVDMIQTSKQLFNEALTVLKRDKCQCVK